MSTRTPSNLPRLLGALLLAVAVLSSASRARADDDPMVPYRERFRAGMARYEAGDLPSAIVDWESIYREVGAEKGYRVAFDLARAYDKTGDPIRAKEKYRAFLAVVDARRAAGLAIEAIVVQEESEARDWIAKSADTTDAAPLGNGVASEPARPGPSASPSPSPVPSPLPFPSLSPSVSPPPAPAKAQPPFSPAFLISSGAATVAAIVVCGIEYANALSAENGFNAAANQPASVQQGYQTSYDNARPLAYASLGASVGFAAITAGLAVWYFTGTKWVVPVVGAGPGGAEAGLVGRF